METIQPTQETPEQTPTTPIVEQVNTDGNTPQESTQQTQPDDLMSRVSKFVVENDPKTKSEDDIDTEVFNDSELRTTIDGIQDESLKNQMVALRKSMIRGGNQKFEELAGYRKELDELKLSINSDPKSWTPERIQSLLNDPSFITAAQQVSGGEGAEDPLAYADDGVKKVVTDLQKQVNDLKTQNNQALTQQQEASRQQEHQQLSAKYSHNYDSKEMDTIYFDMIEGKIQATNEHLYKAFKHDDNVDRAYKMGLKDGREGKEDNLASTSIEGLNTNSSTPAIVPEEKETSQSFLNRIINSKLKILNTRS